MTDRLTNACVCLIFIFSHVNTPPYYLSHPLQEEKLWMKHSSKHALHILLLDWAISQNKGISLLMAKLACVYKWVHTLKYICLHTYAAIVLRGLYAEKLLSVLLGCFGRKPCKAICTCWRTENTAGPKRKDTGRLICNVLQRKVL